VFYEGHSAAFSFNTLVKRGLGRPSVDAPLEALFARGIAPHESSGPRKRNTSLTGVQTGYMSAPSWRKSSIFLRRIVGAIFMRVNSKCAHQARPPLLGGAQRR